jgi:hypothetical protein
MGLGMGGWWGKGAYIDAVVFGELEVELADVGGDLGDGGYCVGV